MEIRKFLKGITKRQWILIAYLPIHLTWYLIAEAVNVTEYTVIYHPLDDLIPFCEWFIFPYLVWFLFMVIPGAYFLIKDGPALENYLLSLFIGFFFSMLIVTLWPTGQELRVAIDPNKNIASWLVAFIYDFDTNTNVFPSMHVVGTLAVCVGVSKSATLGKKLPLNIFIWLLGTAIIAATVFLKQHSILDIFAALVIETLIIIFVYSGKAGKILDWALKEKGSPGA